MRRRRIVNRLVEGAATVAALLAVAVLVIVVGSVVRRGWGAINVDFFTKTPALYSGFGPRPASGIANAIIGTLIIIGIALLMALPVGDPDGDLPERARAAEAGQRAHARVRRAERDPGDRARHLRLRLRRRRPRPGGVEGELRARDPDGADDRPLDPGGASPGPGLDARGEPRARRREVADDPERRPARRRSAESSRARRSRPRARPARRRRSSSRAPSTAIRSATTRGSRSPRSRCSSSPRPSRPTRFSTSRRGAPPRVLIGIILVASLIARWFADRSVRRLKGER